MAVGFYSTNLRFVDGAPPPARPAGTPKSYEYDIVTRTYVNRKTAAAWTSARAAKHFGSL